MTTKESTKEALVYEYKQDIAVVYEEITSEEYIVDRAAWNIADEVTAEIHSTASGGINMTLDRYVTRDYPKAFKHLLPAKAHMIHIEEWEPDGDGYKGTYNVDVKGAPVVVFSEFTLKRKSTGCELRIIHGVTCKIPLVGKKIEQYILKQTRDQFSDQLRFLDLRLSGVADLIPRDISKYPLPKR